MRRHPTLPLLLSCAAMFWACGKKELPVLTVGVIAELSGDIPAVGASCKNAAEMAVGELNEAGGVKVAGKNYQLRLVIEDSKGITLRADLPGVPKDKLSLNVEGDTLTIVGEVSLPMAEGIEATYDKYRYEGEIKTALTLWTNHVLAVVEGRERKVVPLRGA